MSNKVFVYLAEGFEEIEALAVVDILRRARLDVSMISMSDNLKVKGGHGIQVLADVLFKDSDWEAADMLVLPGGGLGTQNLKNHDGLAKVLKACAADKNKWLAAICAAPTVFGRLGLLQGKAAVCFPGEEDELTGATIGEGRVEQCGHIITSRAAGTALEFGLKLVEVLKGSEESDALKTGMLIL